MKKKTTRNIVGKNGIISQIQLEDMRNLSVKEREEIINYFLNGRMEFRKRYDYDFCKQLQIEIIKELGEDCEDLNKDIKKHNAFLEVKQEECDEAEKALKKARKEFEVAKERLAAAKQYHEQLESKLEKTSKILLIRKEQLEEMQKVTLVHATASLRQLYENQFSRLVITNYDENVLEGVIPDVVIEAEKMEQLITQTPIDFDERYCEDAKKSIMAYCNLVANAQMLKEDGIPINLLFSNKDIAEILRLNGLDKF